MTRRATPPPTPDQYAQEFVNAVLAIINREPQSRTAARMRLLKPVGGPWRLWKLDDEPELLAQENANNGLAQALSDAALDLARACVSRLDIAGKSWLAEQMQEGRDEELPGAQPAFFQITLDLLEGEWELRLSACARGAACTLAELSGTAERAQQAAA